jgi:hypothetical protein
MSMEQDDDIQADWSSVELSVLRSAELDVPARGSVERTLAAVGVGVTLGAGVGIGSAAALGAATRFGAATRGSLWLKWLSAALVGGGIAGIVFFARHREKRESTVASGANLSATVVAPAPSTPKLDGQSAASASPPVVTAAEIPPVTQVASAGARVSSAQSAGNGAGAPDAGAALAAEIRLIDEARDRSRAGDAKGSLETLARYDQLVKRGGSMRAEATIVRIEAYQRSGDSARAAALGQRFMQQNPDSPYVEYVKRILARAN